MKLRVGDRVKIGTDEIWIITGIGAIFDGVWNSDDGWWEEDEIQLQLMSNNWPPRVGVEEHLCRMVGCFPISQIKVVTGD